MAVVVGGSSLSNVNLLYLIIGIIIFGLVAVLITICLCIRCTGRKTPKKRGSCTSNRKPSSPSDTQLPHDPEIICHDRLSKTPMLPTSLSTGSSTFNPYDLHTDPTNRYSAQLLTHYEPQGYEQSLSHAGYETVAPSSYDHHSTLSSKYSYTTPVHQKHHDPLSSSYYRPANPYNDMEKQHYRDMDSCLTSL